MNFDSHLDNILEYSSQAKITVEHSMNRYFSTTDLTDEMKTKLSSEIMRTIPPSEQHNRPVY